MEIIKIYSEDKWEEFIREWLESVRGKYADVRRAGGSRDKGRDVIGYLQPIGEGGPWDNYQCKHYDHPLHPSDLWRGLAKLCFYTFEKNTLFQELTILLHRRVGPETLQLLENPENLKAALIAQWARAIS